MIYDNIAKGNRTFLLIAILSLVFFAGAFLLIAENGDYSSADTVNVSDEVDLRNALEGSSADTITITGTFELTSELTIPADKYVYIGSGYTLTNPLENNLIINGTINAQGTLTNNGAVSGTGRLYYATSDQFVNNGTITSYVTQVDISNAEASIGLQYYSTLADAIRAAVNDDAIRILKDVNTSKLPTPESAISITIVLDGNTVYSAETCLLLIANGCTVTIDGSATGSRMVGKIGIAGNNTTLIVNGGTYDALSSESAISTDGSFSNQTLSVSGASLSSISNTVCLAGNGTYTINSCRIDGETGIYMKGGQLSITGTEINAIGSHADPDASHSGTISTGDGIILDALYGYSAPMSLTVYSDVDITSSNSYGIREFVSLNSDDSTLLIDVDTSHITGAVGDLILTDAFVNDERCTFDGNDNFVAKIGNNYFTNLARAYTNAETDSTITLLSNIYVSDLYIGKDLTFSGDYKITVSGTLTLAATLTLSDGSCIEAADIAGGSIGVAKIENTYYGSLADASEASVEEDTITVLTEITLTDTITIKDGVILTFKHTDTAAPEGKIIIPALKSLIINGTLDTSWSTVTASDSNSPVQIQKNTEPALQYGKLIIKGTYKVSETMYDLNNRGMLEIDAGAEVQVGSNKLIGAAGIISIDSGNISMIQNSENTPMSDGYTLIVNGNATVQESKIYPITGLDKVRVAEGGHLTVNGMIINDYLPYNVPRPIENNGTITIASAGRIDMTDGTDGFLTNNGTIDGSGTLALVYASQLIGSGTVGEDVNIDVQYVAKVGDIYYETIQDAIDNAADGSTVSILTDVAIASTLTIDNKSLNFDLLGNEITQIGTFTDTSLIEVSSTGTSDEQKTVTFINGKLTAGQPITTVILIKSAKVTLTEIDIDSSYGQCVRATVNQTSDAPAAVGITDSELVQTGTIAMDSRAAVLAENGAVININSNISSSNGYALLVAETGGTINVARGTIYSGHYAIFAKNTNNSEGIKSTVIVTGGDFDGDIGRSSSVEGNSIIAISGGTFTTCPDYRFAASEYVFCKSGEKYTVEPGVYVAHIGTMGYTSIQSAVNAAVTDDTIVLLSNVVLTDTVSISCKAIALELGDFEISISDNYTATTMFEIWDTGITAETLKTVEISGGTIVSKSPVEVTVNVQSVRFYLTNVTISSSNGQCLAVSIHSDSDPVCTATVKGCTFSNTGNSPELFGAAAVKAAFGTTVDIETSTVTVADGCCLVVDESGGRINVRSGTYSGLYSMYVSNSGTYTHGTNTSYIYVSYGQFTGDIGRYQADDTTATYIISGGSFSVLPDYTYAADGKVFGIEPVGGYYYVKNGSYVAHIGNVGYESVKDALEKGAEGTITLLRNADVEDTIQVDGDHIVDLNSFVMTFKDISNVDTKGGSFTVKNSSTTQGECLLGGGASLTIVGKITLDGIVMHTVGNGSVTGTVELTNVMALSQDTYTYSGEANEPDVSITDNGVGISSGFTTVYKDNVNAGTATVTATFTTGYIGTAASEFTINKAEQKISFTETAPSTTFEKDTYIQVPVRTTGGDGAFSYEIDDTDIAEINAGNGTVTFKTIGTVTVTATAAETDNYLSGQASYSLTIGQGTQTITVEPKQSTVYSQDKYSIGAVLSKGDGTLSYASSDTSIATIDSDGKVTLKKCGEVEITITAAETTNYDGTNTVCKLAITKALQVIVLTDESKTLVYGTTGYCNEIVSAYEISETTFTYSSNNTSVAEVSSTGVLTLHTYGEADIIVESTETTNYQAGSTDYHVVVTAATVKYTHASYEGTYDGEPHTITLTVTEPSSYTIVYRTALDQDYSVNKPTFTDAGTNTVYYKITAAGYGTVTNSDTVTIKKADSSITITEDQRFYYGSSYVIETTDKVGDGEVSFTYYDSEKAILTVKPTAVGSYYVKATVAASDNYKEYSTDKVAFVIDKTAPIYEAPEAISDLIYNGKDQALTDQPSVTGGTMWFRLDGGTWVTSVITGKNAGTYNIEWKIVGDGNHGSVDPTAMTATIGKADITDITAPAAVSDLIYNGADQALVSAGSSTQGTLMYCATQTGTYSEDILKGKDAGSYTVWWYIKGSSNYNDTDPQSISNSIGRKTLTKDMITVEDSGQEYTAAQQDVKYSVVDGDPNKIKSSDYSVSGDVKKKDVGTYTFVVKAESSGNYICADEGISVEWKITKKNLTVTADDKTVSYNDDAPKYTVTYTGLLSPDTEDDLGDLVITCAYAKGSDVGSYDIVPSNLESNNYNIKFVKGTLTVDPKQLTLKNGSESVTKSYDGTVSGTMTLVLGIHYSFEGVVSGDSVDLNNKTYSYQSATVDVAKAEFTSSELNNGNYVLISGEFNATITPREVTIDGISSEDKTYDQNDTAVIKGLSTAALSWIYAGDDVSIDSSGASAKFIGSVRAGTDKTVEFSGFKLTGAKSSNYHLTSQPASDSKAILPAEITVSNDATAITKAYDGTTAGPTIVLGTHYKFSGILSGDSVDFKSTVCTYDAATTAARTVTLDSLELNNSDYVIYSAVLNASIVKSEVTINWPADTFKYDGTEQAVSVTYTNAGGSETAFKVTVSSTFKNAGTYTVSVDFATSDEKSTYTLPAENSKTYTMHQRYIHIQTGSAAKFYDGLKLSNESYTELTDSDGFVDGEGFANVYNYNSITVCGSSDTTSVQNTCDFTLKSGTQMSNYNIETSPGTLSLSKRTVTLTSGSKYATAEVQSLSYNYVTWEDRDDEKGVGFVDGQGVTYQCTSVLTEANKSIPNEFVYTWWDVSYKDNYKVTVVYGTLTIGLCDIEKNKDSLTATYTQSKEYDGSELVFDDITIFYGETEVTFDLSDNKQINVRRVDGEVAAYQMTVTGNGNFYGTITYDYTVTPRSIEGGTATFKLSGETLEDFDLDYTGYNQEISVESLVITVGTKSVTVPKDQYSVTGNTDNKNCSKTYSVTISGGLNYTGTVSKAYTVNPVPLKFKSPDLRSPYTGYSISAKNVTVTGFLGTDGVDHYENQTELIDVAKVKNDYTYVLKDGTLASNYIISTEYGTIEVFARNFSSIQIDSISSQTYCGVSKPLPNAYIKNDSDPIYTLVYDEDNPENNDYTLTYENNDQVTKTGSLAKVTLTACSSNFTGSRTVEFSIVKENLVFTGNSAEKTYDGTPLTNHDFTLISGSVAAGDEYTVKYISEEHSDVGIWKNEIMVVFSDDKGKNYNIVCNAGQLTINAAVYENSVTLPDKQTFEFDGEYHLAAYEGKLPEGDGKKVSYKYDPDKGYRDVTDGFVDITLTLYATSTNYSFSNGSDTYTLTATMQITSVDVSKVTVKALSTPTYNGNQQTVNFGLTYLSMTLTDSDYTVTDNTATDAGTYTASIVLKGNYTGSVTPGYSILKRDITITSKSLSKTYDRTPLESTSADIVESGAGWASTEYATYTMTASITNAGSVDNSFTYEISRSGAEDNYNITIVFGKLTVNKVKMTNVTVGSIAQYDYDGKEKKPTPTVSYLGVNLIEWDEKEHKEDGEFTYSYDRNTYASTSCRLTINAVDGSNYSGTKNVSFTINAISIKITSYSVTKDYDGTSVAFNTFRFGDDDPEWHLEYTLSTGDKVSIKTSYYKDACPFDEYGKVIPYSNTFTCSFSPAAASNSYNIDCVSGTVIINKISMSLTLATSDIESKMSKTYDSKAVVWSDTYYSVSPELKQGGPSSPIVEYKLTTDTEYTTTAPKDAGKYDIRVTIAETNNYYGDFKTAGFTISPRSITLRSDDLTTAFTNNPISCESVTILSGEFVSGEGVSYLNFVSKVAAGSYDNTFEYEFNKDTLSVNYDIEKEYGIITITSLTYDISGLTWDSVMFTYDGRSHQPTLVGTLPTGIDGVQITVEYVGDSRTNVDEGTGHINAYFSTTSVGYTAPSSMSTEFNISKRSIEGANCVLGEDLTYNGSKQTKEVKAVIVSGTMYATYNVSGNERTDAGDNYVMTITGIDNYSGTIYKTFSILKRHITLTSSSGTHVYDGTAYSDARVSIGGSLAPGEEMKFSNFAKCTYVGKYKNTFDWTLVNGKLSNYDFTESSDITYGTIEVTKATQEIYFKNDQVSKYIRDEDFTNELVKNNVYSKILYTSDDPGVASVDEDGKVTINKIGSANITAKTEDNENCYPSEDHYNIQVSLYGIRIAGVDHASIDVQQNQRSVTSSDAYQILNAVVTVDPGYDCYDLSITNLSGSVSVDKTEIGRITRSTGEVIITYEFRMPAMVIQVDATVRAHIMDHYEPQQIDCTHSGNVEYWRCSHCGNYFLDELGASEPVNESEIIQPAYGHDPVYIESSGGMIGHWNCKRCNTDYANAECTIEIYYDITAEVGMQAYITYNAEDTAVSDTEIQEIQTIVEKVKDEGTEDVTVVFKCSNSTVSFSSEYIRALGIQNANIKIVMSKNTITLTPTNLEYIDFTGTANTQFILNVEKTNAYDSKYRSSLNQYCSDVMEFTLVVNGNVVSYLGDLVPTKVTFSYTLAEGKDVANLSVWYLGNELEEFPCTYDEENHTITFETTHLSPYVVVYDEPDTIGVERFYVAVALAAFMILYIAYFGFIRYRKYRRNID